MLHPYFNSQKIFKPIYQQWINQSCKEFGPFKHVANASIPDSCIRKKNSVKKGLHLVCLIGSAK